MRTSTKAWLVAGTAICGVAIGVFAIDAPVPKEAPVQPQSNRGTAAESPGARVDRVAVPVVGAPPPDAERQLFAQAEASLTLEPSRAIDLLRAGDTRFPRGVLADERQFLKLRARVNLNEIAEARVDATNYLELNPRSPIAPRIHRLLGIHPPAELPTR